EAGVKAIALDEIGDEIDTAPRHSVDAARAFGLVDVDPVDPVERLASVAPAGAVRQRARLEQDDAPVGKALTEMPRGRNTGESPADDCDVGDLSATQRRQ